MRLADFIDANVSEIVDEAEAFASTMGLAGARLDKDALRDHIPDMLAVMTLDLRTQQTDGRSRSKSEGKHAPASDSTRTAAQIHASTRALQGFDVVQLVSEYRVLRATVLRLWADRQALDSDSLEDIHRFNEAVDQAIAESVGFFAIEVGRWRNVFLGILGHELRGPLSAILLASEIIGAMETDAPICRNVARIIDGGERMRSLLDDLLDFNRSAFGLGILIKRKQVDLAKACESEIELLRTNWPDRTITFAHSGNTAGSFDESRVREVVWNLVTNAAKYGARSEPIRVTLDGSDTAVHITVKNNGQDISSTQLTELFEPLRRASDQEAETGSLGLGLFVVRQVAIAHGGEVKVQSSNGLTEFSVSLHREPGESRSGIQANT